MTKTTYNVVEHGWNGEKDLGNFDASSRDEAKLLAIEKHYPDLKGDMIEGAKHGMTTRYVSGFKDETKIARCTQCYAEYSDIEMEDLTCCKACGDKGVPMTISEDVNVKINWHELRILSIWAENWARKIQKDDPERNGGALMTIMCIAERLQRQHPGKTPLTLFSEIRELRKDHDIETNIDSDESLGL